LPLSLRDTLLTPIPVLFVHCRYGGGKHSENTVAQGFKTCAAGGIIVATCDYVFMFVFGSEENGSGEAQAPAENKA